jgi:hypothetical protein
MKNLTAFILQQNFHASVFGGKQLDVKSLSAADRAGLLDALDSALSPENLCCDGELRGRALQQKSRLLNGALRDLRSLESK